MVSPTLLPRVRLRFTDGSTDAGPLEGRGFLEFAIVEYLPNQRKLGHNHWSKALVWGGVAPGVALSCALGIAETEFRWRLA